MGGGDGLRRERDSGRYAKTGRESRENWGRGRNFGDRELEGGANKCMGEIRRESQTEREGVKTRVREGERESHKERESVCV